MSTPKSNTAYLVAGVRTPFGRYGGALAPVRPDDLAAHAVGALTRRLPSVDWAAVDDVVLGCTNQAGEDSRNVARMAVLLAGLPVDVPGTTVNRLCGSGLDAVAIAARTVRTGEADLVIAGGVESMTRAPMVLPKAGTAWSRTAEVYDTTIGWRFVNPVMRERYGTHAMPETAEIVAERHGVARADQDLFPDGTLTAGNSAGVNDGAAAVLVASEEAVRRYGLEPLARIGVGAVAGVAPEVMGIGPVPATRKVLARAGLDVAGLDVIELNEAFAAQSLAVTRALGLSDDAEHVNPNGGAIALGHPLGASGARLALTAALELHDRGARRALATMCIGVGQGIAVLFEAA
jgi:3-oxoadipyl-CoA thiolase